MWIPKALCLAAYQMERMKPTYHDGRMFWHCESPVKEPSERKREGCDCGIRAIERALSINAHLLQLSESSGGNHHAWGDGDGTRTVSAVQMKL